MLIMSHSRNNPHISDLKYFPKRVYYSRLQPPKVYSVKLAADTLRLQEGKTRWGPAPFDGFDTYQVPAREATDPMPDVWRGFVLSP